MPVTSNDGDDLSRVLREIGFGRLATTKTKLANSAETRAFLDLGLDLMREDLLEHTGPDFDQGSRSRLFESVSRERILVRAAGHPRTRARLLSVNMFRHRWDRKDRYTEDLISYMFRLSPQRERLDNVDAATEDLIRHVSLGDLVRTLAKTELVTLLGDPLFSLQAVVQSAMPNHPRVREFCQAQLNELLPRWARLYERVATAYGLQVRPGFTWLDIAVLFNAVIEGELVWARMSISPALSNGRSVLSTAILAMLPTLTTGPHRDWDSLFAHR